MPNLDFCAWSKFKDPMIKSIKIIYKKSSMLLQVVSNGLIKTDLDLCTHVSNNSVFNIDFDDKIEFAKRCCGIIIYSEKNKIVIYNDPFCTIPLYYKDSEDIFLASSDPQDIINYKNHHFDIVGVWETLLLDAPLWNRTPYKNVKFLPASCALEIGEKTVLRRYWNFEFETGSERFNKRSYLYDFDDLLTQKFSALRADSFLLGLSGGNDSRLAAHYLAKVQHPKSRIKLVTYSAYPNSNEFRYAREVAGVLGLDMPYFHMLNDQHYREGLEYLPQWTAGQISNLHCHLASYLKENNVLSRNDVQLSCYYTDAVFGWECGDLYNVYDISSSSVYKVISSNSIVSEDIKERMLEDCKNAFSILPKKGDCFSSLDEYKYIAERNPRFHMSLAFIQSQYISTLLPFADIDVISFALKSPVAFRKRKLILDELLRLINPVLSQIGSSANREYFHGQNSRLLHGTFPERMEFRKFRFFNMATQLLAKLSGGRVRFANPYQTEDQVSVYRKSFSNIARKIVENEFLRDCLGDSVVKSVLKDDFFLRNLAERFHLISFYRLSTGPIK